MPGVPIGWTISAEAAGPLAAVSLVILPATGISRVLTSISARILNNTAGAMGPTRLSVLDGATLIFSWILFAPAGASDDYEFSGELIGTPATTMTIKFDVAVIAGQFEDILVKGYDL